MIGHLAIEIKGLRPLPPTPADSRIFGFVYFSENVDLGNFPLGFGVWEGLQSMGNGCGLQMDGFSTHFDPCGLRPQVVVAPTPSPPMATVVVSGQAVAPTTVTGSGFKLKGLRPLPPTPVD